MTVVSPLRPRRGRNVELLLIVAATAIVLLACVSRGSAPTAGAQQPARPRRRLPQDRARLPPGPALWAAYADPILLPVAPPQRPRPVVIHRLDIAHGRSIGEGMAPRQLMWSALAVGCAIAAIIIMRDHRVLRRHLHRRPARIRVAPAAHPAGHRLGQRTAPRSGSPRGLGFQPGEIAKIILAIFFAGYFVRPTTPCPSRDVLGLTLPAPATSARSSSPGCFRHRVLVVERDLGSSLLFFGLFVALLYIATRRISWIIIGLTLFAAGAYRHT